MGRTSQVFIGHGVIMNGSHGEVAIFNFRRVRVRDVSLSGVWTPSMGSTRY